MVGTQILKTIPNGMPSSTAGYSGFASSLRTGYNNNNINILHPSDPLLAGSLTTTTLFCCSSSTTRLDNNSPPPVSPYKLYPLSALDKAANFDPLQASSSSLRSLALQMQEELDIIVVTNQNEPPPPPVPSSRLDLITCDYDESYCLFSSRLGGGGRGGGGLWDDDDEKILKLDFLEEQWQIQQFIPPDSVCVGLLISPTRSTSPAWLALSR